MGTDAAAWCHPFLASPSRNEQELLGLIEDYRQGLLPLIVPLTLLKHHLNRYPVPEWVHQQVYLHPYPKELVLRNHVDTRCGSLHHEAFGLGHG